MTSNVPGSGPLRAAKVRVSTKSTYGPAGTSTAAVTIHVKKGARVQKGARLLVIEAMKMTHTMAAPSAGVIDALLFAVGGQVTDGAQCLTWKSHH